MRRTGPETGNVSAFYASRKCLYLGTVPCMDVYLGVWGVYASIPTARSVQVCTYIPVCMDFQAWRLTYSLACVADNV